VCESVFIVCVCVFNVSMCVSVCLLCVCMFNVSMCVRVCLLCVCVCLMCPCVWVCVYCVCVCLMCPCVWECVFIVCVCVCVECVRISRSAAAGCCIPAGSWLRSAASRAAHRWRAAAGWWSAPAARTESDRNPPSSSEPAGTRPSAAGRTRPGSGPPPSRPAAAAGRCQRSRRAGRSGTSSTWPCHPASAPARWGRRAWRSRWEEPAEPETSGQSGQYKSPSTATKQGKSLIFITRTSEEMKNRRVTSLTAQSRQSPSDPVRSLVNSKLNDPHLNHDWMDRFWFCWDVVCSCQSMCDSVSGFSSVSRMCRILASMETQIRSPSFQISCNVLSPVISAGQALPSRQRWWDAKITGLWSLPSCDL